MPNCPEWAYARKDFSNGRIGLIIPLTFSRARITIGTNLIDYEDSW